MSAKDRIEVGSLRVSPDLYELVVKEVIPGTGVESGDFWSGLESILEALGSENRELLRKRDRLQTQIDEWHLSHAGQPVDIDTYIRFLGEIGYLLPEGQDFEVSTTGVDPEIASIAGPQLVVPVGNARYAVNAVNARWGSLYDALYVSDAIASDDGAEIGEEFNPVRGARVVAFVADFLDGACALKGASHRDVQEYRLALSAGVYSLQAVLCDERVIPLAESVKFVAFRTTDEVLSSVVLRNHGLHIELRLDRSHPVGKLHPAGLKDVFVEAAVSTIQDFEDAESAVDAADKTRLYRSWLGLMQGTLEATFQRGDKLRTRKMNGDRVFKGPVRGEEVVLRGRSLLLVRNVGIHMYTDAVTWRGDEIPEGFLDAIVCAAAAMHDLRRTEGPKNSPAGSVYIVKPKMHGPEEVALVVDLFARVERVLGLAKNTLKIGIMDEERRLTVNLKEAIRAAKERVIFINTGFLDRTGDEIHTDMEAGPVLPKMEIKNTPWILAYEDWNVDIGIETGLPGRGQIGKGMWAAPDAMKDMLESKVSHPLSGATTAWVPSPSAAVLHALHYHQVDVGARQRVLADRPRASLRDLLTLPMLAGRNLSSEEIQRELENNTQGILGYVVRWIQHGVGCSKVPDINDVALMEDRATLRISSQHIANWLHHGLIDREQVVRTFEQMARVVDEQNADDPTYSPMAAAYDTSVAFRTALELVFDGRTEPNGYTETALHRGRRTVKAMHR